MKESYLKNRSNVFEVPVKWIVFLRIFLPIDIVINVLLLIIPIVYSTFSYLNIALDVAVIVINIVQAIAVYRLSQKDYKRLMISWGVMPFIYIIRYLVYSLSINKRLYAADYRIIVVGFIFFILYSWANQVYFRNRKVLFYFGKFVYLSDEAKAVVQKQFNEKFIRICGKVNTVLIDIAFIILVISLAINVSSSRLSDSDKNIRFLLIICGFIVLTIIAWNDKKKEYKRNIIKGVDYVEISAEEIQGIYNLEFTSKRLSNFIAAVSTTVVIVLLGLFINNGIHWITMKVDENSIKESYDISVLNNERVAMLEDIGYSETEISELMNACQSDADRAFVNLLIDDNGGLQFTINPYILSNDLGTEVVKYYNKRLQNYHTLYCSLDDYEEKEVLEQNISEYITAEFNVLIGNSKDYNGVKYYEKYTSWLKESSINVCNEYREIMTLNGYDYCIDNQMTLKCPERLLMLFSGLEYIFSEESKMAKRFDKKVEDIAELKYSGCYEFIVIKSGVRYFINDYLRGDSYIDPDYSYVYMQKYHLNKRTLSALDEGKMWEEYIYYKKFGNCFKVRSLDDLYGVIVYMDIYDPATVASINKLSSEGLASFVSEECVAEIKESTDEKTYKFGEAYAKRKAGVVESVYKWLYGGQDFYDYSEDNILYILDGYLDGDIFSFIDQEYYPIKNGILSPRYNYNDDVM